MQAYTSVSLSARNWRLVLDNLRSNAGELAEALDGAGLEAHRTQLFIEHEELRGVIEQIEDQL